MSGLITAVAVGGAVSSKLSSNATKKASKLQAEGIKDAQSISSEAGEKARADALALYEPAFADISTGLNQAREDILSGRTSAQDVLNKAFSKSSQTLQTSAQQSMNAMLGNQPVTPAPASALREPPQSIPKGVASTFDKPSRTKAAGRSVTTNATATNALPQPTDGGGGFRDFESNMGPFTANDPRASAGLSSPIESREDIQRRELDPLTQDLQPLEGEFIPSSTADTDYNVQAPQGEYGMAPAISDLQDSAAGQVGALTEGAYDAIQSGQQGYDEAGNIITGAFGTGMDMLRSGVDRARGDITGQLDQGISALRSGVQTGRQDIRGSSQSAIGRFDPYAQAGQSALDVEAARSGALGPEAQAAAFEQYNESPGQAWAREQMEKSTLRTQNAIGGVGGANVQKALMRERAGLASQNYQRDLENLRSLAGRGQEAVGSQAGIETQAGRDMSQLAMRGGEVELGARQAAGSELGQIEYGAGKYGAGAAEKAGSSLALLAENRGLYTGGLQSDLSRDVSDVYGETGKLTSGLRMDAGLMVAKQLGLSGQQQAQLESDLGVSFANMDTATANQIAKLAAEHGGAASGLRTGLAALTSNLATGQGTQQANLALQLGDTNASGVTNPWGNAIDNAIGIYSATGGG